MLERSAAKLLQPRINFYTQLKISFELLTWTVERDLRHDIIVICGFTAALVVTLVSQAHFTWCVMKQVVMKIVARIQLKFCLYSHVLSYQELVKLFQTKDK